MPRAKIVQTSVTKIGILLFRLEVSYIHYNKTGLFWRVTIQSTMLHREKATVSERIKNQKKVVEEVWLLDAINESFISQVLRGIFVHWLLGDKTPTAKMMMC